MIIIIIEDVPVLRYLLHKKPKDKLNRKRKVKQGMKTMDRVYY